VIDLELIDVLDCVPYRAKDEEAQFDLFEQEAEPLLMMGEVGQAVDVISYSGI
jgi:hypothetical protein